MARTRGQLMRIPAGTVHAFAVKTETARVLNFYVPAGLDLQQSSTHGASATTILETITPHGRPTMLTGSGTTSPTPGP
jgi:hypothetical protein